MAVTPLVANGRLVINYNADLPHKFQLLVTIVNVGGTWKLNQAGNIISPTYDVATAAADFCTLVKPFYITSYSFIDWALEQESGGAYVEVAVGSLGIAGTNGGTSASTQATQANWSFRDISNKKVNIRMLGLFSGGATKYGYGALSGAAKTFIDDMLNGTSGHLGYWVGGRGAQAISRFQALVTDYNRKSRRRLGLV